MFVKKLLVCEKECPKSWGGPEHPAQMIWVSDWMQRTEPEAAVVLTCSDAGIDRAKTGKLPCIAYRDQKFEQRNGTQDLFGASLLLEDVAALTREDLETVYCRFHGIPLEIARTKRCVIRELSERDLAELYDLSGGWINENSPGMKQLSREEYFAFWKSYIRNMYGFYGFGLWLVTRQEKIIGMAGFSPISYDPELEGEIQISYWIAPKERKKGYAFEVCETLLSQAKELTGSEQICLLTASDNLASIRLSHKLRKYCIFVKKYL